MTTGAFGRWHSQRSEREQSLLALAALVIGAALAWLVVIDPLARATEAIDHALAESRRDLARAKAQRDELVGAQRSIAPPAAEAPRAAVDRLLVQRGLRSQVTALQSKDARVELTFEAIDVASLDGLVEALAREGRLFPAEAMLAARTTPGTVRAELVLVRPAAR